MENSQLLNAVLDCANRAAGTALRLGPEGDIPLEAFHLDSLGLFAFMVEVEKSCGIDFDEILLHAESLRTLRSTADFIASHRAA
jgi:hypothetical protein